jgi:hypothetical protein
MTVSRRHHYLIVAALTLVIIVLGSALTISFSQRIVIAPSPEVTDTVRPFLSTEEIVVIPDQQGSRTEIQHVENVLFEYIEITEGCGPHYEGECILVRSGPGTEYEVQAQLRTGMVLKVGGKVTRDDGSVWYKIIFDEYLRYPDRISGDWYVAAEFVSILYDEGSRTIWENEYATTSLKRIVVDRGNQTLTAYEDDIVFMEVPISTGLELTPTPRGTFTIFKKTPSRYMQGPLPNLADRQVYDLPGVPWNLYFTHDGAVIHGTYWHNSFGSPYSHGCVNLSPQNAKKLYEWAELGITVTVKD